MSGYLADVKKAVTAADEQRGRSQQTQVGWSEVGGCRAAIRYTLDGEWASDDPDTWAAIRGTMIHECVFAARKAVHPHLLHEVETTYGGILGHVDEVDPVADEVTDLKTSRLGTILVWRRDVDALRQKRVQVHGYAAGLVDAGVLTEACTVRILAAPVDGTFADWWEHVEPFDRALANEGVARLADVERHRAAGTPVHELRDKPYGWCEQWCEWFTLCRGSIEYAPEPITDPELAAAVEQYADAAARASTADREKKAFAPLIRGLRGEARGYRVAMTNPTGTKAVPDLDRIRADYAHTGVDLPTMDVPSSTPRLMVTKAKAAGQ